MTEKCSKCGEEMYEIDGILMCKGKYCTHYKTIVEETPTESLVYHREVMFRMKKTRDRIVYLLTTKSQSRNYDDWGFLNFYWKYFLGFTKGMEYTDFWYNQIKKFALPETVRRSHQEVCEDELKLLREMLKLLKGVEYHSAEYFNLQHQIKEHLKTTKLIPTDLNLIKKKLEKQSAIFESVVLDKFEGLIAQ